MGLSHLFYALALICAFLAGYGVRSLMVQATLPLPFLPSDTPVHEVPAAPVDPPVRQMLKVRFLDGNGAVIAEQMIDARARRPVLHHAGSVYHAERVGRDGVWRYRYSR